jgi:hypothetical protein
MNKRILLLIYFLTIYSSISFGKNQFNEKDYLKIANIYFRDSCLYNKSLIYAKKALIIAQKNNDKKSIVESMELIGYSYVESFIYNDLADNYLKKALKIAHENKFYEEIPKIELGIEINKVYEGNFENSIQKIFKILNYFEKKKDAFWILKTEVYISSLYFVQNKNKEVIKQEKKILRLCDKYHNSNEKIYSYIRLAKYYTDVNDYKNSINIFKNILPNYTKLQSGYAQIKYLIGIADYYQRTENYKLCIYYSEIAIKIAQKNNCTSELFDIQTNLGFNYLAHKNISGAKKIAENLIRTTKFIKNKRLIMLKNYYLSAVNYDDKNYKKAFEYQDTCYYYQDSVISEANSNKIEEIRTKYETSKKDEKIKTLNKEKQLANYRFYFFIAGFVVILLVLGFIVNYFINKLKREKIAANHQKEIVELETGKKIKALEIQILYAQMNPHFVFNCLTAIQHLFLSGDRQNANSKLNSFSRLLRLSIDHVKNDYVSLDSELKFLKHYIDLEQLQFKEPFKFELINNLEEDLEELLIPSMMLQPYVENAINHGLKTKKVDCILTMTLNELENNIEIIIEDNGIGRIEAAKVKANSSHQHESRGLSLVHEKILALKDLYGDTVEVTTSDLKDNDGNPNGTRVNLLFSKKIN